MGPGVLDMSMTFKQEYRCIPDIAFCSLTGGILKVHRRDSS